MAAGLGYFDAQGVWRYGESDVEVLASDLLNIGQASVAQQFTADRTRIVALEKVGIRAAVSKDATADGTIAPGTAAYANLDAALALEFSAPPSGKVIISASVPCAVTGPGGLLLSLKASGVDVVGTPARALYVAASGDQIQGVASRDWLITGLTPGTAYSYTLAAKKLGTGTVEVHWGQASNWGPITFSVAAI